MGGWKKPSGGGSGGSLSGLSDVTITSPIDGQVLTYNSATLKWGAENPAGGSGDPLSGKKIGIVGSSSSSIGTAPIMYSQHIAGRTGCVLFNQAVSGQTTDLMVAQLNALPASLDLAFAMPGANDDRLKTNIGVFTDRGNGTFYASLHALGIATTDRYVGMATRMAWSTCHYFAEWSETSTPVITNKTNPYHEAIKEVGNFYGFAVLDARAEGNTPYHRPNFMTTYVQSDRLHLTSDGNLILSYCIEAFWRKCFGDALA